MGEDPELEDDDAEFEQAELDSNYPLDPNNPWQESEAALKARRQRSLFLAVGLAAFVILVFVVTLVKLKGNVLTGSHL
jgi:hypothetical protein